jgi:hypothetical protein
MVAVETQDDRRRFSMTFSPFSRDDGSAGDVALARVDVQEAAREPTAPGEGARVAQVPLVRFPFWTGDVEVHGLAAALDQPLATTLNVRVDG